ncbi:TetR/AcrR family transcriptional regulator [Priestia megaterium]|nr:TetR/AcrR family transcriptional regulator [Priestia megaterium]
MNGFEKRKQQKQEAIRKATLDLFNRYGPKDMNIVQIAKAANVSQVTIYNHFQSKEQLIRETIIDYLMKQLDVYKQLLLNDYPFEQKIEMLMFEKVKSTETINAVFLQKILQEDLELARWFQQFYQKQSLPLVIEFITTAKTRGEISEEISIETILFYVEALKAQLNKIPLSQMNEFNQKRGKEILNVFFYGITGKKGNNNE